MRLLQSFVLFVKKILLATDVNGEFNLFQSILMLVLRDFFNSMNLIRLFKQLIHWDSIYSVFKSVNFKYELLNF
jgi:hypothetical protein